jgi:hypothetical protein
VLHRRFASLIHHYRFLLLLLKLAAQYSLRFFRTGANNYSIKPGRAIFLLFLTGRTHTMSHEFPENLAGD